MEQIIWPITLLVTVIFIGSVVLSIWQISRSDNTEERQHQQRLAVTEKMIDVLAVTAQAAMVQAQAVKADVALNHKLYTQEEAQKCLSPSAEILPQQSKTSTPRRSNSHQVSLEESLNSSPPSAPQERRTKQS